MKKGCLAAVIITVVVVAIILVSTLIGTYNSLVTMNEEVQTALSQIDNQLQRRNDLIPNLVETVKGYAAHENEIFQSIAEARSKLMGAGTMQERADADAEVRSALNRLMVIVENYPNLKADASFRQLSDELAGTENRIAAARRDYNNIARDYNTRIRRFPSSIIAGIFNFERFEYFEAQEGAREVPNVDFSK
jgi:LemA protein